MIYLAFYENPIPKDLEKFFLDTAEKYKNKFGNHPNSCKISPLLAEIGNKIGDISIVRDKYVPNFQFWFFEEKIHGIS